MVVPEVVLALQRHLPGLDVADLVPLGEGQENRVYMLGEAYVVRLRKEPDPEARRLAVEREHELLELVGRVSPLPVPEVLFAAAELGMLAYPKLPGTALLGRSNPDPARLAAQLGPFLEASHALPVETVEHLVEPDVQALEGWREDAERDYLELVEHIPATDRDLVERFLAAAPPPAPTVFTFCHNDLGAEHLLVGDDGMTITGVLDWSDAAITDPAYDLGLLLRDLGPEVTNGIDADDEARARATFYARCALLEDLAYGVRTGHDRYAVAALVNLRGTFSQP